MFPRSEQTTNPFLEGRPKVDKLERGARRWLQIIWLLCTLGFIITMLPIVYGPHPASLKLAELAVGFGVSSLIAIIGMLIVDA